MQSVGKDCRLWLIIHTCALTLSVCWLADRLVGSNKRFVILCHCLAAIFMVRVVLALCVKSFRRTTSKTPFGRKGWHNTLYYLILCTIHKCINVSKMSPLIFSSPNNNYLVQIDQKYKRYAKELTIYNIESYFFLHTQNVLIAHL